MTPWIDSGDLVDAHGVAEIRGLARRNTVSQCQRRYRGVPRPSVNLGGGRPQQWLRSEMEQWARRQAEAGRTRSAWRSFSRIVGSLAAPAPNLLESRSEKPDWLCLSLFSTVHGSTSGLATARMPVVKPGVPRRPAAGRRRSSSRSRRSQAEPRATGWGPAPALTAATCSAGERSGSTRSFSPSSHVPDRAPRPECRRRPVIAFAADDDPRTRASCQEP
jgi:hypothetical protein